MDTARSDPSERSVVLLREAWVKRVADFIGAAGTEEEARIEGRPEIVFSKIDQSGLGIHYADFNVRSRHFRCLESFFVETDATGAFHAVVGLDGLRGDKRILNVNLIVVRRGDEPLSRRLPTLLQATLAQANRFAAVAKLRLIYIYDHSFAAPLGAHVAKALIESHEELGLVEEARIANETGAGREAVLLAVCAAPAEAPAPA